MGNFCSKRKNSDISSVKSEGSNKRNQGSLDETENHSDGSKRPSQNGGATSQPVPAGGPNEGQPAAVAGGNIFPIPAGKGRGFPPSSFSDSISSPTAFEIPHPFELPYEMSKQTDNVKNLMLGRVTKVKPLVKGRKITLYICASFSQDFRLEKGIFHTQVYPSLREYCSSRGYELHVTDLHWKADLEIQQDHQFPELCIGELTRQQEVSYVIPILFLSNSLGESLLPKMIEQQDFEVNLKNIGDSESRDLMEKWYKLDTQAEPPCYRLKPVAAHFPKITSNNDQEKSEAIEGWHGIVEQIMGVMLRVFPIELRDIYLTTVIEQEIHNSIFMSTEVGKRSIWVNRVFTHIQTGPDSGDDENSIESDKNRRLENLRNELKNQLMGNHILRLLVKWQEGGLSEEYQEHQTYLEQLSSQLSSQLRSVLDETMEEGKGKALWKSLYGVDGLLCSELMQHNNFCQQAAKCSVPIENFLNTINKYISNDTNYPLVIHGPKGCGKTSFLSRAVQQCLSSFPEAIVLYRYIGLTPESRSAVQILRSLVSQVGFLLKGQNYWIPHKLSCYIEELTRLISNHSESTLIIVLDGLDQVEPLIISEWTWLSENLSSRMKIIVSCSDDTSVFQSLKTSVKKDDAFLFLPNPSQQSAEGLLTANLLQYCHSAGSEFQKRFSSRLKHCTLPLFIKVLAWEAAIDSQGMIDVTGFTDVNAAVHSLFNYLEKSLGKEKVSEALALMCASRYGLSDSEILDLLAYIPAFCSNITHLDWAPAALFMAHLCKKLGPFLEWSLAGGTLVIRWRDRLIFDIAKERYIGNKEDENKARQRLLSYFEGNLQDKQNGRYINVTQQLGNRHNQRKLEEIPFQHFQLEKSIKSSYLCNEVWLLEKLQGSSVFNIIEDIILEANGDRLKLDPDVNLLLQTLELSASALSYDGQQLYNQVRGRLLTVFESSSSTVEKYPFMKSLFEHSNAPKVPSFIPTLVSLLHSPSAVDDESNKLNFFELTTRLGYFDQITRLKSGNQFVVSLSTANEEVIVWDVYDEIPIRTLRGVFNPVNLKIIDNTRVVILCGRELQIYNLDDGSFISKMKGVMNQQKAFFGLALDDDNHIVALSRNRMYVNLMNLSNGECISTFKVGEDRFLNSLIVSENGKILVCGDETQKPFPLLVWDLNSKKLLYDLRIPHHEFLTNLSAITKEGHFVCCVCREVDDPGPNFIVVYDLQSGTLFKKWKPGFSTLAITISAQGGCVINALIDNRILVWDLVTGACKYSLSKHTAPADTLRLDHTGARCLSWDSLGRDRSVCLWNLTNGTLLSLFTPDIPFSAVEVSNDGFGIILGLKGTTQIARIEYKTENSKKGEKPKEIFGSKENFGKIIDLKNP